MRDCTELQRLVEQRLFYFQYKNNIRYQYKIRITIQYYEYKACVLALFPTRMSFYLILMRTSHSLLSLTSPCSHPLLPPPSLSPCLTLTVIQFWHLLPEPPPTCLPNLSYPPLQLHIFVYSLYISVLLLFFITVCMLCLCLVSYHVVYSIGQLTPKSSCESLCVVGWGLTVVLSVEGPLVSFSPFFSQRVTLLQHSLLTFGA